VESAEVSLDAAEVSLDAAEVSLEVAKATRDEAEVSQSDEMVVLARPLSAKRTSRLWCRRALTRRLQPD
jgi:hypothetical protein